MPLIDLAAQLAQLFDMRQNLAADLFLIGIGQTGDFGNGLFECLDHLFILARDLVSRICQIEPRISLAARNRPRLRASMQTPFRAPSCDDGARHRVARVGAAL